jgi:hypothetical protein
VAVSLRILNFLTRYILCYNYLPIGFPPILHSLSMRLCLPLFCFLMQYMHVRKASSCAAWSTSGRAAYLSMLYNKSRSIALRACAQLFRCRYVACRAVRKSWAAGLVGAANIVPCHASSRATSTTLHLQWHAGFSGIGMKEEHEFRWG